MASRSGALLAESPRAEDLFVQAIDRLGRTRIAVDLARAHLLYGERLRRERRRMDAREELRVAHELFSDFGMEAFSERAMIELLATVPGAGGPSRTPASRSPAWGTPCPLGVEPREEVVEHPEPAESRAHPALFGHVDLAEVECLRRLARTDPSDRTDGRPNPTDVTHPGHGAHLPGRPSCPTLGALLPEAEAYPITRYPNEERQEILGALAYNAVDMTSTTRRSARPRVPQCEQYAPTLMRDRTKS